MVCSAACESAPRLLACLGLPWDKWFIRMGIRRSGACPTSCSRFGVGRGGSTVWMFRRGSVGASTRLRLRSMCRWRFRLGAGRSLVVYPLAGQYGNEVAHGHECDLL